MEAWERSIRKVFGKDAARCAENAERWRDHLLKDESGIRNKENVAGVGLSLESWFLIRYCQYGNNPGREEATGCGTN